MKKLTDDYGNDLLDENGCVQFLDDEEPKGYSLIRFNPLPPPSVSKHIEYAPDRLDWLATYRRTKSSEGIKDYKIIIKGNISVVKNWIKKRYSNCIDNDMRFELHKDGNMHIVFLPKFNKKES